MTAKPWYERTGLMHQKIGRAKQLPKNARERLALAHRLIRVLDGGRNPFFDALALTIIHSHQQIWMSRGQRGSPQWDAYMVRRSI